MAATSVLTSTTTTVLNASTGGHIVFFQNNDTTNPFYVRPTSGDLGVLPSMGTTEFKIPKAADADNPSTLMIQSSGGDTTIVRCAWVAWQNSGGTLTSLTCSRW